MCNTPDPQRNGESLEQFIWRRARQKLARTIANGKNQTTAELFRVLAQELTAADAALKQIATDRAPDENLEQFILNARTNMAQGHPDGENPLACEETTSSMIATSLALNEVATVLNQIVGRINNGDVRASGAV